MKQTAVEWLEEELKKVHHPTEAMIMYAKKLEKQQIIDAYYGYELYLDREFRFQQGGQAKILTFDQWYKTYGSKGSDDHIVDANKMVKKGTLKKRMDKDSWFVVFQSNAYNEIDMAYELLKSQEIDIDMYDVYKDGDEVTFEVVNKKWAKITPFLYPFKTTSSQTEISDEEIFYQKQVMNPYPSTKHLYTAWEKGFMECAKWYREQLKIKQNEINNTKL